MICRSAQWGSLQDPPKARFGLVNDWKTCNGRARPPPHVCESHLFHIFLHSCAGFCVEAPCKEVLYAVEPR